ncbi:MAG TPA: glycolate oxidase subunit GlcE [Burkholderiales bacterium]|nr:glycolate oxidase subunit GlcE [Burkholderiales bacterium]
MSNLEEQFAEQIREAENKRLSLRIRGSGSKDFYGLPMDESPVLDTRGHSGIVDYEPTELVVTARCGTPLAELETLVEQSGQMLPFEPPHFGPAATLGGMLAAGLSGPRRATAGALRDHTLGVKMLDGRGQALSFGGQVMKNVAGYDLSRVMPGSLGTLGLVLEVSLKTLPRPQMEATLRFELPQDRAIESLNRWAGRPLPISASLWTGSDEGGELSLRLSGAEPAIDAAAAHLGGERVAEAQARALWQTVREQRHAFFARAVAAGTPLWRLSVPSTTPVAALQALGTEPLIEWGGALRWFAGRRGDAARIRQVARQAGGHATLFRAEDALRREAGVFQPLAAPLDRIHRDLKTAFDPHGLFNPGRMYAGF